MWPRSLTKDSRDTAAVVAETFHHQSSIANPKQTCSSNYAVMLLPNLRDSAINWSISTR